MKKQFKVAELIRNKFDKSTYKAFLKTVFEPNLDEVYLEVGNNYKPYVKNAERLGYFEGKRKKIYFYIVEIENKDLERARVFQRDFIARELENESQENAMVVFHSGDKWRLSFIKVDYIEDENRITKKRRTAKRFSFYVGKDEVNNTCVQRLNKLLEKENISVSDVEEVFNVEKVTEEFFKKYNELFGGLYLEVKRLKETDFLIRKEFEEKGITENDFAKKILGQIVFLYFLQKKGWLGVKRDSVTNNFGEFGSGDKQFMRTFYETAIKNGRNFFNDYLEHLFYDALAKSERESEDWAFELDRNEWKIPFLNGGLFEPLGEYNWRRTDIKIEDKVFGEIFDTFDMYNFTVREDEPMEKEVAIDPEMLGKVFENLLDTKERKSTGSFYTPREIVHYMCQQSLINYLETKTSINRETLEKFISKSEDSVPEEILERKKDVDSALVEIKIVDPAVGSGAFLVGMMTEIVRARSLLNPEKKIFDLKEECIENSLHGVDIAPGAVDICQLRLWLSLIVDEEDYGNVKPLPNLDYKIMCGNSLIEDYKGMKLWDDKWLGIKKTGPTKKEQLAEMDQEIRMEEKELNELLNDKVAFKKKQIEIKRLRNKKDALAKSSEGKDGTLSQSDSERKLIRLKKLHEEFVHISDRASKKKKKEEIEGATIELIKSKLKEEGKESEFEELKQIMQKKRAMPFFLWKMNFIDVFQRENPGFDVVIGNPPYVDSEEMVRTMPKEREEIALKYKTAKGNWDLYIPFFELGFDYCKSGGILTFITPNKWLSMTYGRELRKLFSEEIILLGNCDLIKVFEAGNTPEIVFIKKGKYQKSVILHSFNKDYTISEKKNLTRELFREDNWGIVLSKNLSLLLKILCCKKKIQDFSTPENPFTVSEAYILKDFLYEGNKKNEEDDFKLITTGSIDKYISFWGFERTSYIKDKYSFPLVKKEQFKKILPKRFNQSESAKIIISGIRYFECFLDENGDYVAGKSTVIIRKINSPLNLFSLLAILNSKLISFFIKESFSATGIGGGVNFTVPMICSLPCPDIKNKEAERLENLAKKILIITKDEDYLENQEKKAKVKEYENQIDEMVYKLYELTPEEIKIIEGFGKKD